MKGKVHSFVSKATGAISFRHNRNVLLFGCYLSNVAFYLTGRNLKIQRVFIKKLYEHSQKTKLSKQPLWNTSIFVESYFNKFESFFENFSLKR